MIRSCHPAGGAHKFVWPREVGAIVTAPDWRDDSKCGGGLHGLGPGDDDPGQWYGGAEGAYYVAFDGTEVRDLGGKRKCREAKILHAANSMAELSLWLYQHGHTGPWHRFVYETDDSLTLTAGDNSNLTAGDHSILTAGYESILTAGYESILTAGDRSTLTAGYRSNLTAGYRSNLTAGDRSTLTAGDRSILTAGYRSNLTAGYRSILTAGDESILTAGYGSNLTAGDGSVFVIRGWRNGRYRAFTAVVGENGIKPNVPYRLDDDGEFVEVTA